MRKKVMLGMSGGVDSSVAALLLLRQGFDVTGVTMKLRPDQYLKNSESGGCCSLDDIDDARRAAYQLGIEHLVLNFTDLFQREVIDYFAAEYEAGRTPNPCIACNRRLKFSALLRRALELDFDYVATGHYARVSQDAAGRWRLFRAHSGKDQSYVLYSLTQFQLEHTLLPLGGYEKSKIRELAEEAGLAVAQKPDSQEICFVEGNDYGAFLEKYTGKKPPAGHFVDAQGTVLGEHRGIPYYTIGQRKGLGLSFGQPMYVTRIDAEKNEVVLGPEGSQYRDSLVAGDLNWIAFDRLEGSLEAQAKIRYQAQPAQAEVAPLDGGKAAVHFLEPQRSVTPGQAVVFYQGDAVLGGGTILE